MKPALTAALLILLFISSNGARADDLSGQSRTYLPYRQGLDGTHYIPLYEYLDLQAPSIGTDTLSFQFGGWYRYDLNDSGRDRTTGDLQYAWLDIHSQQGNASLRLGRVLVTEGVAAEHVDGAYARTDLKGGFTIAAFGGLPIETSGDSRSNDSIYGGRISQGMTGIYVIGLSYLLEKNDSKDFRKEEGVDIWLQPLDKMTLQGISSYNLLSRNWMQHHYYALFGPFGGLRLTGEFSKVYYKDYFAATTLSAFTFPSIDPNEIVTTAGGSADYTFATHFTIAADIKNLDYDKANDSAKYYGGRLTYASSRLGFGIAAHRINGPTAPLRYDEQRIYLTFKVYPMDVTLDFLHLKYKQPINGVDNAYTAVAAADIALSPVVRLGGDVEYSKNPDFDKDIRCMLKLIWRFDVAAAATTKKNGAMEHKGPATASRYVTTAPVQETL